MEALGAAGAVQSVPGAVESGAAAYAAIKKAGGSDEAAIGAAAMAAGVGADGAMDARAAGALVALAVTRGGMPPQRTLGRALSVHDALTSMALGETRTCTNDRGVKVIVRLRPARFSECQDCARARPFRPPACAADTPLAV